MKKCTNRHFLAFFGLNVADQRKLLMRTCTCPNWHSAVHGCMPPMSKKNFVPASHRMLRNDFGIDICFSVSNARPFQTSLHQTKLFYCYICFAQNNLKLWIWANLSILQLMWDAQNFFLDLVYYRPTPCCSYMYIKCYKKKGLSNLQCSGSRGFEILFKILHNRRHVNREISITIF